MKKTENYKDVLLFIGAVNEVGVGSFINGYETARHDVFSLFDSAEELPVVNQHGDYGTISKHPFKLNNKVIVVVEQTSDSWGDGSNYSIYEAEPVVQTDYVRV